MMVSLAIVFWILSALSAPTWCWVCWWICAVYTVIELVFKAIKLGMKWGEE